MIAGVEKAKLVYILNRNAAANLTISLPLEAHKNAAIIHYIIGLDVGFENPMFAALEVDYTESDQDPTWEAFNNAEKVRHHSTSYIVSCLASFVLDANNILRTRPRLEPRRPKMERTN